MVNNLLHDHLSDMCRSQTMSPVFSQSYRNFVQNALLGRKQQSGPVSLGEALGSVLSILPGILTAVLGSGWCHPLFDEPAEAHWSRGSFPSSLSWKWWHQRLLEKWQQHCCDNNSQCSPSTHWWSRHCAGHAGNPVTSKCYCYSHFTNEERGQARVSPTQNSTPARAPRPTFLTL